MLLIDYYHYYYYTFFSFDKMRSRKIVPKIVGECDANE